MSEQNGSEKPKKKQLSFVQFYAATEWLKKNKDRVYAERPTAAELAPLMSRELGFGVSLGTVATLKESTKIAWEPKRLSGKKNGSIRMNQIRTLATSLHRLYERLNEEPPATLVALVEVCTGHTLEAPCPPK